MMSQRTTSFPELTLSGQTPAMEFGVRPEGQTSHTATKAISGRGASTAQPTSEVAADPVLRAAYESILEIGLRRTTLADVARRAKVSRMTVYRRYDDLERLLAALLAAELNPLLNLDSVQFDSNESGLSGKVGIPDAVGIAALNTAGENARKTKSSHESRSPAAHSTATATPSSATTTKARVRAGGIEPPLTRTTCEQLADAIAQTAVALAQHPLLNRILSVDPEALLPLIVDRFGSTQQFALSELTSKIAQAQSAGDGSVREMDPATAALMIMSSIQSVVFSFRALSARQDPTQIESELAEMINRYLASPQTSTQEA